MCIDRDIWVVGHKNPDTDSICAAIAYANLKNLADDLASGGSATLGVAVGSDAIVSGTALATIKGSGKMTIATSPVFTEAESDVKLVVGTAALTAGKIAVGVIYG